MCIISIMFFCAGKDFICVQSMDGTVSVFEQESFSFSRFLPGTLLPGPIGYVEKTDSIVTVASSRQVDCFKCVLRLYRLSLVLTVNMLHNCND